jgi:hypothetical protein
MGVWNRVELALLILKTDASRVEARTGWKTEFKAEVEEEEQKIVAM